MADINIHHDHNGWHANSFHAPHAKHTVTFRNHASRSCRVCFQDCKTFNIVDLSLDAESNDVLFLIFDRKKTGFHVQDANMFCIVDAQGGPPYDIIIDS